MLGAKLLTDCIDREKIAAERQRGPDQPHDNKEDRFHRRSVARRETVVNVALRVAKMKALRAARGLLAQAVEQYDTDVGAWRT